MAVALVTGAAKRLGRAMALYLANRGYAVAVHYASSGTQAELLVSEIRDKGGQAQPFSADLLDEVQTSALIPRVRAEMGAPVTCLVNNASIFEADDLVTATRTSWDRHIESNLRAPVVLTQALAAQAPNPVQDSAGEQVAQSLVVNMIDQRVRNLTPEYMSYTVAKMGLWAFTRTSAQALAPKVRVNAIGPGPTMAGPTQSREAFEAERAGTILGRGAELDDITAALGYLVDAKAVTGQLICVDGGQHLGWPSP